MWAGGTPTAGCVASVMTCSIAREVIAARHLTKAKRKLADLLWPGLACTF